MTAVQLALVVVAGVAVVLLLSLVTMYNRFVRQRTPVDESWGQTDVELTRRHDLIPQLVATVRGYAEHERAVLEALTRAREQATAHQDGAPAVREGFEDALSRAVSSVLVRAEAYPDL
jgi:LemA protein